MSPGSRQLGSGAARFWRLRSCRRSRRLKEEDLMVLVCWVPVVPVVPSVLLGSTDSGFGPPERDQNLSSCSDSGLIWIQVNQSIRYV